ncbi:MAG: hypothetical protein ACM3NF_06595, partial [Gemmatimonadota bacterium]
MRVGKVLLALSLIVATGGGVAPAAQSPQVPLAGTAIPQFVDPLPTLSVAGGTMTTEFGNQPLTLRMCEFQAHILPTGTFVAGARPATWVWGYLVDPVGGQTCAQLVDYHFNGAVDGTTGPLDTYIGPVIVNNRGSATPITFINDLGSAATTNVLAYKYSTDQTLHWADP